jgi:hypothetical protein
MCWLVQVWNDVLLLLRELCFSVPDLAQRLFGQDLLLFLFSLMAFSSFFDHAVGLIEEILADQVTDALEPSRAGRVRVKGPCSSPLCVSLLAVPDVLPRPGAQPRRPSAGVLAEVRGWYRSQYRPTTTSA